MKRETKMTTVSHDDESATVTAFLDLLAKDIDNNPGAVGPQSDDSFEYMQRLAASRTPGDEARLDDSSEGD